MALGPSADMHKFREVVKSSKNIIVVAGAGLSAASGDRLPIINISIHIVDEPPLLGIPTFRDGGGLWRKYEAMSLATPEAFGQNSSRVWQFYHMRREK